MFCIFSSKSGDSSWNVWWVIVRTSKSWQTHRYTHTHTDTGDDNTRRPKGPRVKMILDATLRSFSTKIFMSYWKPIFISQIMVKFTWQEFTCDIQSFILLLILLQARLPFRSLIHRLIIVKSPNPKLWALAACVAPKPKPRASVQQLWKLGNLGWFSADL